MADYAEGIDTYYYYFIKVHPHWTCRLSVHKNILVSDSDKTEIKEKIPRPKGSKIESLVLTHGLERRKRERVLYNDTRVTDK